MGRLLLRVIGGPYQRTRFHHLNANLPRRRSPIGEFLWSYPSIHFGVIGSWLKILPNCEDAYPHGVQIA